MAYIVQSVTRIKYKGKYMPANTPFEVPDEDLEDMKKAGCHTIRQVRNTSRKVSALDMKFKQDK